MLVVILFGMNVGSVYAAGNQVNTVDVPLKYICEAQGAIVNWNGTSQTVTVTKGSSSFSIVIGSKQALVNGKTVTLDNAPLVINGRTKIPLTFINQSLATNITMDDCIKILTVKSMDIFNTGSINDFQVFCSDRLNQALPIVANQMVNITKALGESQQQSIIVDKNEVHQNVTVTYATSSMGTVSLTFRYNNDAQLDDISPLKPVTDIAYKAPAYDQPDTYTESQVVVGSGEWQLPAILTMPKGQGPFPVVVLVHGSGPNDRDETIGPLKDFRDLAVGLAAQKVAVLRYDKRTWEHSLACVLDPKFTVYDETIDDAVAAVNLLKTVPGIDVSRIYVLGHSQGGMCMPRIINAAAAGSIKGAIIMSGPTRPFLDIMPDQYKYLIGVGMATEQQYEVIKAQMDMIKDPSFNPEHPPQGYQMGSPYWWDDIKNCNPAAEAVKQTTPLLILQGQRDYQVTAAQDYKGWQDALAGRDNVTFKLYPKLNHVYTEGEGSMSTPAEYAKQANIPAYVIDDISQWIKTTS